MYDTVLNHMVADEIQLHTTIGALKFASKLIRSMTANPASLRRTCVVIGKKPKQSLVLNGYRRSKTTSIAERQSGAPRMPSPRLI